MSLVSRSNMSSTLRIQCFRAMLYSNRLHRWQSYGQLKLKASPTSIRIEKQVVVFISLRSLITLSGVYEKTSSRHINVYPISTVCGFCQSAHVSLCAIPCREREWLLMSHRWLNEESDRQWPILTGKPGVLRLTLLSLLSANITVLEEKIYTCNRF